MQKETLYTTGQFMKLTHVTKKTVRYYDEHNILKPSFVDEKGRRYFTEHDLAKMQQILLLKHLKFSLTEIRELMINDSDPHFFELSLKLQKKMVDDKIEQLQVISQAISDTAMAIQQEDNVDWSRMLELIHSMGLEQSMKTQYQNASNISTRINLHALYSQNRQGWFPWIFEQCEIKNKLRILEIGCGDGSFWIENRKLLPETVSVTVSDISDGMLRDARRAIGVEDTRFSFAAFDCQDIPYKDESFDLVIANHVLFYCEDRKKACAEIRRVLKKGGKLITSTYGTEHMKEVSKLVADFDDRIKLSAKQLYECFGKENGAALLEPYFAKVFWREYEDSLFVPEVDALVSYVLSCHGNQNQYILDRYSDFRSFVKKYIGKGIIITKEAGVFICEK